MAPLPPSRRQGVTVEGEQFVDTSGVAKQVFLFTALKPTDPPKWDHGLYSLRSGAHPGLCRKLRGG